MEEWFKEKHGLVLFGLVWFGESFVGVLARATWGQHSCSADWSHLPNAMHSVQCQSMTEHNRCSIEMQLGSTNNRSSHVLF